MPTPPQLYSWVLTLPASAPPSTSRFSTGNASLPASFQQISTWFLLLFPASWIQFALLSGTATSALFTAMCDVLGQAAGDTVLPINGAATSVLKQQLRIATATGNTLDQIALDFYGQSLPRGAGEADTSYRARLIGGLFIGRVTEPHVVAFLKNLTGFTPHIIVENSRPSATGCWTSCSNVAGIILVSGVSYFPSFDSNLEPGGTGGLLPPAFWGEDVQGAAFRWVLPFTFDVLIETTFPQNWGAQGNNAYGYATITGSGPPDVRCRVSRQSSMGILRCLRTSRGIFTVLR